MSGNKTILLRIAVVVLMSAALCGCKKRDEPVPTGASPDPQAAAEMSPTDAFLAKQGLQGKVALIEFGVIGCELSEAGLERMMDLHRKGSIPGISYVMVEASKDKAVVDEYYSTKSPPFPVHHDPDGETAKAFNATVVPTFVLVDKFGRVRAKGKLPEYKQLSAWSRALLAESSDAGPDVPLYGEVELAVPELLAATVLPELKGGRKKLGDHAGKGGLMVMFVDTTCPFSTAAVGEAKSVVGVLKTHGINSALINLDDAEQDVRKYFRSRDTGTPVLFDVTTQTKLRWNVQSVPTVVLVDASKAIAYNGPAVWADLAKAAEGALGLATGTISFEQKGTQYG